MSGYVFLPWAALFLPVPGLNKKLQLCSLLAHPEILFCGKAKDLTLRERRSLQLFGSRDNVELCLRLVPCLC